LFAKVPEIMLFNSQQIMGKLGGRGGRGGGGNAGGTRASFEVPVHSFRVFAAE
jgi:hypothetical protein